MVFIVINIIVKRFKNVLTIILGERQALVTNVDYHVADLFAAYNVYEYADSYHANEIKKLKIRSNPNANENIFNTY